ncbi:hypothetical protein N9L24_01975 [Candidatus Marinamargulisbacteria bacterium]|nr:hypothetical protein [Candidatus Marinamargulisbacteria bacterium]
MIPILWIQATASLSMLTLIILVQVVIYPQFAHVGHSELTDYAMAHVRRISYVVVPIMLAEAASLAGLWAFPNAHTPALYWTTTLLALIWLLTFIKIVPIHNQLCAHGNPQNIPLLVKLNAYRTGLWILKTGAVGWMLFEHWHRLAIPLT